VGELRESPTLARCVANTHGRSPPSTPSSPSPLGSSGRSCGPSGPPWGRERADIARCVANTHVRSTAKHAELAEILGRSCGPSGFANTPVRSPPSTPSSPGPRVVAADLQVRRWCWRRSCANRSARVARESEPVTHRPASPSTRRSPARSRRSRQGKRRCGAGAGVVYARPARRGTRVPAECSSIAVETAKAPTPWQPQFRLEQPPGLPTGFRTCMSLP
jgi:hypothetical protein